MPLQLQAGKYIVEASLIFNAWGSLGAGLSLPVDDLLNFLLLGK